MRTAEPAAAADGEPSRRLIWPALALVLGGGLALRLWGVRQGLPFAYNTDEAQHFVPHAVEMFEDGTLNPHYFENPPAFTYLLHLLYDVWYGGARGAIRAFRLHPQDLYTLARVASALLGTAALWLLYAAGARLLDRTVGLLAAAVMAVAFLPVFYAHLALNDVPTLAPLTLSLLGSAGILRRGRARDHVIAGAGLGLACATKYTAGIAILPMIAAILLQPGRESRGHSGRVALGLVIAGGCAAVAFVLANPFSLLDFSRFHAELAHQSRLSAESQGKLGAPREGGLLYYLWSLTWGLGWVPALAALGGALAIWRSDRRLGLMLVPAPLLFLAFMGLQGRYFGRWLMPALPFLCLLAAFLAQRAAGALRRRAGAAMRPAATVAGAAIVALLLLQGLLYSIHAGLVLSRPDTRNLARTWMLAHVPRGSKIVVEPIAPDEWADAIAPGTSTATNPRLWVKYPSMFSRISRSGALQPGFTGEVSIENYERTLAPSLVGYYLRSGFCWVISGSTQSGRAEADPRAVPLAVAYYRELARRGQVVYRASPYTGGASVGFNFDWSFDYYPLAYRRPGPLVTIYRLHGGLCG